MYDSKSSTPTYVELSSDVYSTLVDAYASANQRALDYAKSVYEIMTRPYASTAVETTVRENFERANQIVNLTVGELQGSGQRNVELFEKMLSFASKLQETALETFRGLMKTGLSNMNYVKETTDAQFEGFAKRVEELQSRAISAN